MAKRTYFAVAQQVTVSRWSYEKNGLKKNAEKLNTIRLGGNVRITMEACKENILARFTEGAIPFMLDGDNNPICNGLQTTIEVSYSNIRLGAERWIKDVTPETRKSLENSQVFHVALNTPMLERTFELTEIVEDLGETYYCVSYENGNIKIDKRNEHEFKTHVMRVIACPELGLTEESAIAKWHSSHKTAEEIAKIKDEHRKRMAEIVKKSTGTKAAEGE